jgi:hypothetical protein
MVENNKMRRRVVTVALGVGVAFGAGVGATALAAAATSPSTSQPNSSTSTTVPAQKHGPGRGGFGGRFGGPAAFGGGFGGFAGGAGGPVLHGEYTVKGPNGYETIDVRSGTVSSVTDTSGSTWTLVVKSADGTSGTFTVNSSTSVNGGESGIASVKTGDTVSVTATTSGTTATATQVMDQTTLQANGKSWMPMGGKPPAGGETPSSPPSGAPNTSTAA